MPDKIQKNLGDVFKFASLSGYTWRKRFLIRLIDWFFYVLISLIGRTIRFETEGFENFEASENAEKPAIYAFWHDRIFLSTYYFKNRGIVVITSQSFDGEYIARFIQRFGYGVVRGSSTRGGIGALVEMIRLMKQNLPMTFTIDGPKGPRYVAKKGAILLAKKTGNPILSVIVETKNFWTVNSWDKLQIPKPFSKAKVFVSEPIFVASNADDDEIENKRCELQMKLDELTRLGKQWRENEM